MGLPPGREYSTFFWSRGAPAAKAAQAAARIRTDVRMEGNCINEPDYFGERPAANRL